MTSFSEETPQEDSEVWVSLTTYDSLGDTISENHMDELHFKMNSETVFKSLRDAIKGMVRGQTKMLELKCNQTFGNYLPEKIMHINKDMIPDSSTLKEGMTIAHKPKELQVEQYGRIIKISKETITIDNNHPLAGQRLSYKVTLKDFK